MIDSKLTNQNGHASDTSQLAFSIKWVRHQVRQRNRWEVKSNLAKILINWLKTKEIFFTTNELLQTQVSNVTLVEMAFR